MGDRRMWAVMAVVVLAIWLVGAAVDAPVVATLARERDVSEITASVLVRRGYDEPDGARRFLDAGLPGHDPFLLGDMSTAVERIHAAIGEGRRICVHGDYDVDG